MTSYSSTNSLDSSSASIGAPNQPTPVCENPEQFEVRKQQKEIWENGIEM